MIERLKVVLITGASAGLGLAMAKQLIADGNHLLVLTSRSKSKVRFEDHSIFEAPRIWLRDMDMINHDQVAKVVDEINEKLGGVDVLINNAGITERATVEDTDDHGRQRQLDVNYLAPFELISKVLPLMRKRRSGHIINISSAGGFMAMPTMSAYSASKFALEAASEALWYEMRPWGVHVTLAIPGFINSRGYLNTLNSAKCEMSENNCSSAYYEHYRAMRELIAISMKRTRATNDSVAKKVAKIIGQRRPPLRVHITFEAKLLYLMRKFLPSATYHFIFYNLLPNIHSWGKNTFQRPKTAKAIELPFNPPKQRAVNLKQCRS